MSDGAGTPLDRLLAWSAGQDAVRAVVLMGSQARTEMPADEWSDTDVLVVTEDPGLLLGTQRWAGEAFGALVLSFTEPTPLAGLRE
nr:nucleotidyltransferase domain-containing protein [Geodermatophilaceae bacterium]